VLLALLLVAAFAVGRGSLRIGGSSDGSPGDAGSARVLRVVDGDTILVRWHGARERVRYIGIDTPESVAPGRPVECFGKAAAAENTRLVAGRTVTLRTDVEARDRYGRLLAYVYLPSSGGRMFVNAELVRRGYAQPLTIPPNVRHASELRALAAQARAADRGLWRACAGD
jgi:micrococcal nuclease